MTRASLSCTPSLSLNTHILKPCPKNDLDIIRVGVCGLTDQPRICSPPLMPPAECDPWVLMLLLHEPNRSSTERRPNAFQMAPPICSQILSALPHVGAESSFPLLLTSAPLFILIVPVFPTCNDGSFRSLERLDCWVINSRAWMLIRDLDGSSAKSKRNRKDSKN